ncbi:protein ABIL1-like isoform X2 [Amaranthus tricolor]|uniref:protein ABIL1-like isoform X2 n=1 Tax=Amaranthus tricolor TaxID=29722 RepID=UPI0025872BF4|nr:protein ABIL1-like isoform X2 [Amaranthus tricolor]
MIEEKRILRSATHANGKLKAQFNESLPFLKSLQDLRAQIEEAADYCEKSYLKSEDKALVLHNTKEYLCRSVVTIVDHLGSVSASLDCCIQTSSRAHELETRINCLKQKLDSYDQFHYNFTLTKIRWSTDLPRHHPRYILPQSDPSKESSSPPRELNHPTDLIKDGGSELKIVEDVPLLLHTSSNEICLGTSPSSPLVIHAKDITAMPVHDGFAAAPKLIRNPSFQFQDIRRPGGIRRLLHWKSANDEEILSILRRSKKQPSRLLKLKQKLHLDFSL